MNKVKLVLIVAAALSGAVALPLAVAAQGIGRGAAEGAAAGGDAAGPVGSVVGGAVGGVVGGVAGGVKGVLARGAAANRLSLLSSPPLLSSSRLLPAPLRSSLPA
jgi:phage tail tape-measure protein